MRYFFRSWRDSLSLFLPQNAKLLCLASLKSIVQSVRILLRNAWWLFIASAVTEYSYLRYFPQTFFCIIPLLLWLTTIFIIYLVLRPSLAPKNWRYYRAHARYFVPFVVFTFIIALIPFTVILLNNLIISWTFNTNSAFSILFIPLLTLPALLSFVIAPNILPLYASPLLSSMIFFVLDRPLSIGNCFKAIWRALKMIIYNYPFCIIIYSLFVLVAYGMQRACLLLGGASTFLLSTLVGTICLLIPLSILSVFYSKRLHDQFNLYYPESVKE